MKLTRESTDFLNMAKMCKTVRVLARNRKCLQLEIALPGNVFRRVTLFSEGVTDVSANSS